MRRPAPVALALALVTAGLATSRAQQTPDSSPQPTFRSRTDLVPVDVSVLDRDRRPVRGLTPADFTLLVDGKPRPIAAFAEIEIPRASPAGGPSLSPGPPDRPRDAVPDELPGEGRLVVILMDGSIPDGAPTVTARRIAHAAVDQLGPGDVAAVVRTTVFSHNGGSQGFTHDRALLIDAIDSPFMGATSPPTMGMDGLQSPPPVTVPLFQVQLQCEALFNIARAMRDAPRRHKLVLFVGSQLALGGTVFTGGERSDCRDRMIKELVGSNVTVHVVDPIGVLTAAVAADYLGRVRPGLVQNWAQQNQSRLDTLRVLPEKTGGRAVLNTNTPESDVPALFEESRTYYLLGFDPQTLAADKPTHDIRVEVRHRWGTVHSRTSYGRRESEASAGR